MILDRKSGVVSTTDVLPEKKKHYVGVTYQYSQFSAYGITVIGSEAKTHAAAPFVAFYAKPTLSSFLSTGPQHVEFFIAVANLPLVVAHWNGKHKLERKAQTLVISTFDSLAESRGCSELSDSSNANIVVTGRLTRTWSVEARGGYAIDKNVTSFLPLAGPGGHSISGKFRSNIPSPSI